MGFSYFTSIKHALIIIFILLSLVELLPYFITIFLPNLCYGCTPIGKFQQELNQAYYLSHVTWFSYLLLMIYYLYWSSNLKNNYYKYFFATLFILLIVLPVYPIINIFNIIFFVLYKNGPFLDNHHSLFPQSKPIEDSATDIINEFNKYRNKNNIDCIRKVNPGYKIELSNNDNNCWRGLYLKRAGNIDTLLKPYFSETIKVLEDKQIHNAFFSILDPGVEIPKHTGYYKGYLRYHLGVLIPNNNDVSNDKKAYIVCGNERYYWKEKEGVLFDDMYIHYVKNPSNKPRVVLYLDIKRPPTNYLVDLLNGFGIFLIENSPLLSIFVKNQHLQKKIND